MLVFWKKNWAPRRNVKNGFVLRSGSSLWLSHSCSIPTWLSQFITVVRVSRLLSRLQMYNTDLVE
jgi:hypothetical protein